MGEIVNVVFYCFHFLYTSTLFKYKAKYPAASLEGSQTTGALSMLNYDKRFIQFIITL
jgi:hypothetical protein